jgi:hypothetical protein
LGSKLETSSKKKTELAAGPVCLNKNTGCHTVLFSSDIATTNN